MTLVRLEPASLWSQVKHSTTEPLRSLQISPITHIQRREVMKAQTNIKVKIHTFFERIYYRAYSIVGIIPHYFFCEYSSISL